MHLGQPARNGQPASGVQFCGRGVCAAVTGRLLLRRVAVQVRRAAETERHPGQGDGRDGRWQWHRTRLGDAIRRQRSMRGGVGHQQGMSTIVVIQRSPITGNMYFININTLFLTAMPIYGILILMLIFYIP